MITDTRLLCRRLNPGCFTSLRILQVPLVMLALTVTGCGGSASVGSDNAASTTPSPGTDNSLSAIAQLVTPLQGDTPFSNGFDDNRLLEVSGVQRASTLEGAYFVHNDSGEPLIYATDAFGQILGTVTVGSDDAIDWEALSTARIGTTSNLIVADIGDNDRQRSDLSLLVVEEPLLNELPPGFSTAVTGRRIELSYGDSLSYDAEGLIVDDDTVVLLTKDAGDTANQSIWTGSITAGLSNGRIVLDYEGLVSLASENFINAITDVDIHPARSEIAVLTYGSIIGSGRIHLWTLRNAESVAETLMRLADEVITVPTLGANVQAEGISYSSDGDFLLVAAEGFGGSTLTIVER